MSSLPDPIRAGLARGWKVFGAEHAPLPERLTVDVAVIGSGAGGGITAEMLARAGLSVVVIEEGPLRSSSDFKQRESDAYTQLYQDAGGRKTADKAINILQGRCVGGSTTVNWTSSFRTPDATLHFWAERFGLTDLSPAAMAPWFAQAEARVGVSDWLAEPNPNNAVLARGAKAMGIAAPLIRRNVKGCWNLGSCGMGCPTNAKQSMLTTTLPAALDAGAQLLVQARAQALLISDAQRVTGVRCVAVGLNGSPTGPSCTVTARHVVLAGGAINSPALLLRSKAPDPHKRLGRRTFLHPTSVSAATFKEAIAGWAGAPQTVYSDHFLGTNPIDGPLGYKLEAAPIHPVIMATTMAGFGEAQLAQMRQFPHSQVLLALLRDGFHPESQGGTVRLKGDGSPDLDYPLNAPVMEAVRRSLLSMAELQFAAGATSVQPVHELAPGYTSWAEARAGIAQLPMQPLLTRVVSAHVMGGCGMASSPEQGVTRPDGQHWQLEGLSVHDGSLFPTSIGANPQLSIYGLVNRLTHGLMGRLGVKAVALA
jgi:choline dehydrogenase-like flavoprotein